MPANPAILIRTGPDDDRDWRRFVAILCFIEFYCGFVQSGTYAWHRWNSPRHPSVFFAFSWYFSSSSLGPNLLAIVRSLIFLMVGRALWTEKRAAPWIWPVVLLSIATITATIWCDWKEVRALSALAGWRGYLMFLGNTMLPSLRWLAIGCVALLVLGHKKTKRHRADWVILAATWSLVSSLMVWTSGEWISVPWTAHVLWIVPLIVAGLLLPGIHLARTAALAMGLLQLIPNTMAMYTLNLLIYRASQALIFSSLYPAENPLPMPWFVLSRDNFIFVFVESVRLMGPWLLIAWYADRKPMFEFPDDGSPWPRRYCGKCYYNLHGVDADRCPECGATLIAADRGSGRPLRHP